MPQVRHNVFGVDGEQRGMNDLLNTGDIYGRIVYIRMVAVNQQSDDGESGKKDGRFTQGVQDTLSAGRARTHLRARLRWTTSLNGSLVTCEQNGQIFLLMLKGRLNDEYGSA